MNKYIEQLLKKYEIKSETNKVNAIKEVIQEIVLCALSRADFFNKAAFYGGTALRIFYGLNRFSEDLDFSLQSKDEDFDFSEYLPVIEKEINNLGLNIRVEEKIKTKDSNIKSAFLKANIKEQLLYFYSEEEYIKNTNPRELLKIKLEIDINPPKYATFEHKYMLLPMPYNICLYDMPSLFAGKLHAVICRSWKSRVKGRDLYDLIFYLQNKTKFNLKHLRERLVQSEFIDKDVKITLDDVKNMLIERFEKINFEEAKEDVQSFIQNKDELNIWSKEFFISIINELQCM